MRFMQRQIVKVNGRMHSVHYNFNGIKELTDDKVFFKTPLYLQDVLNHFKITIIKKKDFLFKGVFDKASVVKAR